MLSVLREQEEKQRQLLDQTVLQLEGRVAQLTGKPSGRGVYKPFSSLKSAQQRTERILLFRRQVEKAITSCKMDGVRRD
jgi:hypothetical protein